MYKTIVTRIVSGLFVGTITLAGTSYASGNHSHDHESQHSPQDKTEMFLEKRHIDGFDISFHVMPATSDMKHGGSHNLMVKIENSTKTLTDVKINSKVIHPSGKSEVKPLMKMGEWFMNGYDLGHDGKHQLMVLFKTADGEKHKAGLYYYN